MIYFGPNYPLFTEESGEWLNKGNCSWHSEQFVKKELRGESGRHPHPTASPNRIPWTPVLSKLWLPTLVLLAVLSGDCRLSAQSCKSLGDTLLPPASCPWRVCMWLWHTVSVHHWARIHVAGRPLLLHLASNSGLVKSRGSEVEYLPYKGTACS